MDDVEVELRRLREQVYGVRGAEATPDEVARLAELEDAVRRAAAVPVLAAGPVGAPETAHPFDAPPALAHEPPSSTPDLADGRLVEGVAVAAPMRRRAAWVAGAVVGGLALIGLGFAAGSLSTALSSAAATPTPDAVSWPELTFPQTQDDVISAGLLEDSGIDPASTRYIATIRDFRIFLAQRDNGQGICIVSYTVVDDMPWSAGCALGGGHDAGGLFGVDSVLSIAVGDAGGRGAKGTPIRLSDSVTAYLVD